MLSSSFPFLPFPSLLSREEIQIFPGLLHKGLHIYFLLFCELFTLEYNFERNLEERGLLWSKVLIGMDIEDRARSFSEVSGWFIHRVIQKFSWILGWYRGKVIFGHLVYSYQSTRLFSQHMFLIFCATYFYGAYTIPKDQYSMSNQISMLGGFFLL